MKFLPTRVQRSDSLPELSPEWCTSVRWNEVPSYTSPEEWLSSWAIPWMMFKWKMNEVPSYTSPEEWLSFYLTLVSNRIVFLLRECSAWPPFRCSYSKFPQLAEVYRVPKSFKFLMFVILLYASVKLLVLDSLDQWAPIQWSVCPWLCPDDVSFAIVEVTEWVPPVQVSNVTICCLSSGESSSKKSVYLYLPHPCLTLSDARDLYFLSYARNFKSMSKCCPISMTRSSESMCQLVPLMLNEFRQSMVAMPVLKFEPPQDLMLLLPFYLQVVPTS